VSTQRLGTRLLDLDVDAYLFIALAAAFRTMATSLHPMGVTAALSGGIKALTGLRVPRQRLTHKVISEVIGALSAGQRLNQADAAARLGIDSSHLGRVLKDDSGLRFDEWRTAIIMRNAARLLMLGDTMVSQIGYKLGFQHPSQFVREFQDVFGVSPRQVRIQLGGASRNCPVSLSIRQVAGAPN